MYLRATVGEQTLDTLLFICVNMLYIFHFQFCYYAPETLMYIALSINGSFFVYSNI